MTVRINVIASYEANDDFTTRESNINIKKSGYGEAFTEKDLQEIIEKITALAETAKQKTPFAVVEKSHVQLNEITFTFILLDDEEHVVEEYSEFFIFEEAIQYDSLIPLIEQYFDTTLQGMEEPIWSDPEFPIPFGTAAIYNLAKKDKSYITKYISFLKKNDLDHETEQMWHILDIIDEHQWCPETLQLATTRLLTCAGQAGTEQFQELYQGYRTEAGDYQSEETGPLENYLQDSSNRALFTRYIVEELQEYALKFPGYFEDSLEYCFKQMKYALRDLEKYLNPEEMETVKTELEKVWETAPKANS